MKNIGIFLVIAGLAFACSSDDDAPPPPQTMDFDAFINSGGPAINIGGNDWVADDNNQNSDATDIFESEDPNLEIAGTDNDALYRTEVFDLDVFTYNIAVPGEATLDVSLHFAEIYHDVEEPGGIGSRVFDVDIEGQATLSNYDIIEQAGAAATAVVESFNNISVQDGSLTITFTTVVDAAKVNAIEVTGTYIVP